MARLTPFKYLSSRKACFTLKGNPLTKKPRNYSSQILKICQATLREINSSVQPDGVGVMYLYKGKIFYKQLYAPTMFEQQMIRGVVGKRRRFIYWSMFGLSFVNCDSTERQIVSRPSLRMTAFILTNQSIIIIYQINIFQSFSFEHNKLVIIQVLYIKIFLNVINKFVIFLIRMSESQNKYDFQKVQQKPSQKKRKAYIQSNIQNQNIAQQINHQNNYHKKPSIKSFHIQQLPIQIHQLILTNKLLLSQNKLLQCELKQKQELIKILKKDIHKSIIQETQNKLYCLNVIQEEAESKAKQIIHRKLRYIHTDDSQLYLLKQHNNQLQAFLNKQAKANHILAQNVVELKDYIIQAMDQKDQIIKQLKKMIMIAEQEKSTNQHIAQPKKHNIKRDCYQLQSKTIKMPQKANKAKIIRNN